MATTTPANWEGKTPTLTQEKVQAFEEMYKTALADMDKAGSVDDHEFYTGWSLSLKWVLDVLHDVPDVVANTDPTTWIEIPVKE